MNCEPESASETLPQLMMCRWHLRDLPAVDVLDGHSIRCFREGDGPAWDQIMCNAFGWAQSVESHFEREMRADPRFRPQRVLLVCREDRPVGTASAWPESEYGGPETGVLHYVGVMEQQAGRGLGYQVSLAAIHQMVREHRQRALLRTDDIRIPAIQLYLKLGFGPFLVHQSHRHRWRDVFDRIERPQLKHVYADSLDGVLEPPNVKEVT